LAFLNKQQTAAQDRAHRQGRDYIGLIAPVQPPSSLPNLTLFYCGKAGLGHFLRASSLNRMTIRLKRAQKLPQAGLSLATNG
jgi:hypothetical protein